jgi:hypothetical protein
MILKHNMLKVQNLQNLLFISKISCIIFFTTKMSFEK